jgi:hypothetical protein
VSEVVVRRLERRVRQRRPIGGPARHVQVGQRESQEDRDRQHEEDDPSRHDLHQDRLVTDALEPEEVRIEAPRPVQPRPHQDQPEEPEPPAHDSADPAEIEVAQVDLLEQASTALEVRKIAHHGTILPLMAGCVRSERPGPGDRRTVARRERYLRNPRS